MPAGGQLGSGVRIFFDDSGASPPNWVEVTQILEDEPPGKERDRQEVSTHGVTTLRRYIPGLADVTDLRFQVLANITAGSEHLTLRDLEESQELRWWRVEIPIDSDLSTTQYLPDEFQGRVSTWKMNTPIDGPKTIDIVVQFGGTNLYHLYPSATVG